MKLRTTYFITTTWLCLCWCAQVMAQSGNLVVVDGAFANSNELKEALGTNESVLTLTTNKNPWETIRLELLKNKAITTIHLFTNATYNELQMGGKTYHLENLGQEFELSNLEGLYDGTHYQLLLYNCNLASNTEGLALLREIGNRTYFNISAPTSCTNALDAEIEFDFFTIQEPSTPSIFKTKK